MKTTPQKIVVDLTPLLPGGENGGAKIFVLDLVRRLGALYPETQFVLLIQAASRDEIMPVASANISCHVLQGPSTANALRPRLEGMVRQLLPYVPDGGRRLILRMGYGVNRVLKRGGTGGLLRELGADLLFCPFTAPTYFEPGIPVVCTIYDVQYKTYPCFFEPEDLAHRDQTFKDACGRATALGAISEYARKTALFYSSLDSERIRTIHLRMARRISVRPGENLSVLDRLDLAPRQYVLYPANFWKHKNHEMLLTAFGMACHSGLDKDIKLVCTGAPGPRQVWLARAAAGLGLGSRVVFPGYLPEKDLAVVLANARGLIFPSLYEGFGIPVVEAMAAGVPVACSSLTALPEVAADAAIFFDPKMPNQIADALKTLVQDDLVRERLIAAGYRRADEFSDSDRMAREYWDLFTAAMNE